MAVIFWSKAWAALVTWQRVFGHKFSDLSASQYLLVQLAKAQRKRKRDNDDGYIAECLHGFVVNRIPMTWHGAKCTQCWIWWQVLCVPSRYFRFWRWALLFYKWRSIVKESTPCLAEGKQSRRPAMASWTCTGGTPERGSIPKITNSPWGKTAKAVSLPFQLISLSNTYFLNLWIGDNWSISELT